MYYTHVYNIHARRVSTPDSYRRSSRPVKSSNTSLRTAGPNWFTAIAYIYFNRMRDIGWINSGSVPEAGFDWYIRALCVCSATQYQLRSTTGSCIGISSREKNSDLIKLYADSELWIISRRSISKLFGLWCINRESACWLYTLIWISTNFQLHYRVHVLRVDCRVMKFCLRSKSDLSLTTSRRRCLRPTARTRR